MVRQKSAKTAKVFFHVGFVVYGILAGVMPASLQLLQIRFGLLVVC